MKIAFILPGCGISGGIGIVLHYANALARMGHHVDLFNLSDQEYNYWYGNIECNIITCSDIEKIRHISPIEYDCCIATFWTTLHQIRSGILATKSVLYLVQGNEADFYEADDGVMREGVRQSYIGPEIKVVIAKWIYEKLKISYAQEEIVLLENGVDVDKFSQASPFMTRGNKIRILVEGPISEPIKRIRQTLSELSRLDGIEIWLVSSVEGDLTGMTPNLSLFSVPWAEMPSIYKSCDILIKNSSTEGFPLPVLEAMASGCVPIVNELGYTKDFLSHKEDSYILQSVTTDSLFEAIRFVSSNIVRLRENVKRKIERYRWSDHVVQLEKYIEKASKTSNPPIKPSRQFASQDPRQLPATWVRQSNRFSSQATFNGHGTIVGWIGSTQTGDVSSAKISCEGVVTDISPNEKRSDVASFLGIDGNYGFRSTLFANIFNKDVKLEIASGQADEATVFQFTAGLGEFKFGDITLYVEKLPTSNDVNVDIDANKNLMNVFVSYDNPVDVVIQGQKFLTSSLFENRGLLELPKEKPMRVIERYEA